MACLCKPATPLKFVLAPRTMAFIKCYEYGSQISTEVAARPKCGA